MTIDDLARADEIRTAVQPWVEIGAPDPRTGVVRGTVRIVDRGDRTVRFGPERIGTATGGLVVVDPRTGDFTYTPSPAARQVARARSHHPDTVDAFTLHAAAHGTRVEVHVVVDVIADSAAAEPVSADRVVPPSEGVKSNTLLGGAKEVQWHPIHVEGGSTVRIQSTSGGTSSLAVGPLGEHTLTFTSSGGSFFNKGPAGSVVLRVTDSSGSHTDSTYTY